MVDKHLSDRPNSKTVKQSIISDIFKDSKLRPLLAEAYFNQIRDYFPPLLDLLGQCHLILPQEKHFLSNHHIGSLL